MNPPTIPVRPAVPESEEDLARALHLVEQAREILLSRLAPPAAHPAPYLSGCERAILGAMSRNEYRKINTICRLAGYRGNSYIRATISQLCGKGLVERGPKGTYRVHPCTRGGAA